MLTDWIKAQYRASHAELRDRLAEGVLLVITADELRIKFYGEQAMHQGKTIFEVIATDCYAMADAMIEARNAR